MSSLNITKIIWEERACYVLFNWFCGTWLCALSSFWSLFSLWQPGQVLTLAWPVPGMGRQSCMPHFGNMATGPSSLSGFPFSLRTVFPLCFLASEASFGALQVPFSWEALRDAVGCTGTAPSPPYLDHIWWRKLLANPKLPLCWKAGMNMARCPKHAC